MKLRTVTLTNQNISNYLLVDTFTITNEREYIIRVLLNQVTGNGDYSIYAEVQREGTGVFYRYDNADYVVPSGVTSIAMQTILTAVTDKDVVKVYVVGTPSDTATVDIIVDWFYLNYATASPTGIASVVWAYPERTLSPGFPMTTVNVTNVPVIRGDTFEYIFTDLDLDDYDKVYFTSKREYKDEDSSSVIQIDSSFGLVYLNGVISTTGNGAYIEVNDIDKKARVVIEADVTKEFIYTTKDYVYDLQIIKNDGTIITPKLGDFVLVRDVTRATT